MTCNENQDLTSHSTPPISPSKELVDYTIHFLSTSSNQTLACVVACLTVITYVLLGRVGLFLIGLVAGIALHASWEATDIDLKGGQAGHPKANRRKELSLSITNRLLDSPGRNLTKTISDDARCHLKVAEQISQDELDFSGFPPRTADALRSLTDAVIRDYVHHWYEPILPTELTFPLSCRKLLTGFIFSLSSHISRKRTADTFLELLTNSSSMAIVFLNELSTALRTVDGCLTPEDTVKKYLELYPESSLANVLSEQQQRKKLNMAADDILSNFLDPQAYACSVLREFLREILAGVIFESTISSLSRSDFINGWIIHLLREGEPEIMSAIDAGVEGAQEQNIATIKDVSNELKSTLATAETSASEGKWDSYSDDQDTCFAKRATEDAIIGTRRLSAMTAAQGSQKHNLEFSSHKKSPSSASFTNETTVHAIAGTQDGDVEGYTSSDTRDSTKVPISCEPTSTKISETHHSTQVPSTPTSRSTSPPSIVSSTTSVTTLRCASVSIDDCSEPGEKAPFRSKPTSDYLIQIEPASTRSTGWMVLRNYADFESLHETIETISRLNRLQSFAERHPVLPPWKGQTKQGLARNLERYLQDALKHEALADCEKVKRFLEKNEHFGLDSRNVSMKSGFPFATQVAFENMGKGVLGVLSNAPKGVAEGGKAVLDGVTGVFGGGSSKRASSSLKGVQEPHGRSPPDRSKKEHADERKNRGIEHILTTPGDSEIDETICSPTGVITDNNCSHEGDCSEVLTGPGSNKTLGANASDIEIPNLSFDGQFSEVAPSGLKENGEMNSYLKTKEEQTMPDGQPSRREQQTPITQEETQIAVELIFAVINELYSLSSAWNIRRTLLNAAKSYILRPGSPNLGAIRALLQESMIEANTSDEALAFYLTKLRENALPTEEELKSWPQSPSVSDKVRLRDTAKKVLVHKGLPQTLTGVMGAAASREALEKVFDCLQVDMIARGLIFSVLLQGLRAVTF